MFYGAEEFIADFHAQVMACAEFVGTREGMSDPSAFRRSKLSMLRFGDGRIVSADAARELFWRRFEGFLSAQRDRGFAEGATWRSLADKEALGRRIEVYLAELFTFLRPLNRG